MHGSTDPRGRRVTRAALGGLVAGLVAGVACAGDPPTPERLVWDKTPIRLTLTVGHERMLHFPAAVRVGVPPHVDAALRTQSVDGTVYLQALQPFDTARVMVRETTSGATYLFDLRALAEGGSRRPVEIHASARPKTQGAGEAAGEVADESDLDVGYVALTRFAAQQLYAPRRLVRELPGLLRVPVPNRAVALVRGGAVQATPLAAWQAGGLHVTAVKLRNTTRRPRVLDPRNLRGRWLAATFQHARLLPAGDEADTTCVYLISVRPFEDAGV